LRLHAEMGAGLLKGDLDRPAHDDPCQDLLRRGTVTVQWSLTPKAVFAGTKHLYPYASDQAGLEFPYSPIGTWAILSPSGATTAAADQVHMHSETPWSSDPGAEAPDASSPSLMRESMQWRQGTRWAIEVHTRRDYRSGPPDWQRATYHFDVIAEPGTNAQPYYVVTVRNADAPAEALDDEAASGGPPVLWTLHYAVQDDRLRLVRGMRGRDDTHAVRASELPLITGDSALALTLPGDSALALTLPRQLSPDAFDRTGGQPVQFLSRLLGRAIAARQHALPSGGYALWSPGLPWYVYMETEGLRAELIGVHP
jgi:hypothetical protein